jgi:hypothetical protein
MGLPLGLIAKKSFVVLAGKNDFLAIRPSGNPITAEDLAGMYNSADLVIELSELVKIHRLEANSDWGFAAFTLKEAFSYKGECSKSPIRISFHSMNLY